MADKAAALAIAGFGVPSTLAVVDKFLPELNEVRHASPDDPLVTRDVRVGEAAIMVWLLGIGGYVAWLLHSRHPVFLAGAGGLFIAGAYECALRSAQATE